MQRAGCLLGSLAGHPSRVRPSWSLCIRGCSLRSYPRLLSGDAFSVYTAGRALPCWSLLGRSAPQARPHRGLRSVTEGTLAHPRYVCSLYIPTLNGSPSCLVGHPSRVRLSWPLCIRGCSLRSYPRLLSGDAFSVYTQLAKRAFRGLPLGHPCPGEPPPDYYSISSKCWKSLHEVQSPPHSNPASMKSL